ncbi:MAG: aspartate-semialdehyde dehydrogenase [Chloroflexota bacterium]|nr:aspartate-semialdehyde dehydrogenase [Chloroflexota bacterium]
MTAPRVAIVGATGAVGQVALQVLEERNFPVGGLHLCASERSLGKRIPFRGRDYEVELATPQLFAECDLALISVSAAVSRELAPMAVAQGCVVIDDSSAFRMQPNVPLVVPEVNAADAEAHEGILSIPNCSTTPVVMALWPIHQVNPVRRIVAATYQSVSGTGKAAVEELRVQSAQALEGRPVSPDQYPHQIAFNVIPQVEGFLDDGYTNEERKMRDETRKIMHAPDLAVSATCVRVPVVVSHSEALHVEFERPVSPDEARRLMTGFPGLTIVDDPAASAYPMPIDAQDSDQVYVGRIREDSSLPGALAMWVVSDNLRKGAATNAVQIAEELLERGALLRPVPHGA